MMKYTAKHRFTLVELIVVMTIMGIMMAIALPAFTGISKGQELNNAAQEIAGQISIARAYAMANHAYVAVVFPQAEELNALPGSESDKNKSAIINFYNASCRIALVTKISSGEYQFVMWKNDSPWIILQAGTMIPTGDSYFKTMNKKLKNVRMGDLIKLYKSTPTAADMEEEMDIERYIIIRPDGQLVADGNTVESGLSGHSNKKVIRVTVMEGGYYYNNARKK